VRPWIVGDNKAVGGGPVIQFQARVMADIEPILTWSFVR
jgi:hypothetical protein